MLSRAEAPKLGCEAQSLECIVYACAFLWTAVERRRNSCCVCVLRGKLLLEAHTHLHGGAQVSHARTAMQLRQSRPRVIVVVVALPDWCVYARADSRQLV